MKNKIKYIIAIIIFIVGLGLILYPTVSNYINSFRHRKIIKQYNDDVSKISEEEYNNFLEDAKSYNEKLFNNKISIGNIDEKEKKEYESLLNINDTGIMAYIEIHSIKVLLPIYHGTTEATLQAGVGHIEGTSLPIGGVNTHSVISGHRGLPSSKLFTDISKLKIGDTFTIRVLQEILTYEIDQIETVEPQELDLLQIEEGKDYVTLVTCTPYGINTHRLLVRGHRIETPSEDINRSNELINKDNNNLLIIITCSLVILLVIILMVIKYLKGHK